MFNNLIESKPKKQRTTGGLDLQRRPARRHRHRGRLRDAAGQGADREAEGREGRVRRDEEEEPPPPKEEPPPPPKDVVVAPPPPKGFQVLTAPVEDPRRDPRHRPLQEGHGRGRLLRQGRRGRCRQGRRGRHRAGQHRPAVLRVPGREAGRRRSRASGSPRYPDMLRSAGVEGEVLAQFVVDTTGRAETGTLQGPQVQRTSSSRRRCKNALPHMRFYPRRSRRHEGEAARAAAVHVRAHKVS